MAKLDVKVYGIDGKEGKTISLPEAVFNAPWNADLIHQVVVSMESNARLSTAHTKFRSEVSGGGKKPWRQKGTGSARHGSRRSPIWVGGGVSHGPRNERDYSKKINKKMRLKALCAGLSQKLRDGEMLFMEKLELPKISVKEMDNVFKALEKVKGFETINTNKANNILLVIPKHDEILKKSSKNIDRLSVCESEKLNVADLFKYRYVVVADAENTVSSIESKLQIKKD